MAHERNTFALLVGIDSYQPPVPALRGCQNDIEAFANLLVARSTDERLHIQVLLNEDATRQSVIAGFRDHLSQASEGDVAIFYYSGHGSQEPTPKEWWHLEPDRLDETLVLHDSRSEGHWDLADKELSALIAGVAAKGPDIVVVLDCCHSGSGTRASLEDGVQGRRAPTDRRSRPISSFLFDPVKVATHSQAGRERGTQGESGWELNQGDHVLLAGCRSNETSKEVLVDGHFRGALSAALERTLCSSSGSLTYREIHRQVAAIVGTMVRAQSPQLEATRSRDLEKPFLSGAISEVPTYFVVTYDGKKWVMDGGHVHGVAPPRHGEHSTIEVRGTGGSFAASAVVTSVRTGEATLSIVSGELESARVYRGTVTASPLPPILIKIEGSVGAPDLREAIALRNQQGSLLVTEAAPTEEPQLVVSCDSTGYSVTRAGSDRLAVPRPTTPEAAVGVLEHIGSWMRVADLHNVSTLSPHRTVAVEIAAETAPSAEVSTLNGQIRLEYLNDANEGYRPQEYTVTLTNISDRILWVALLDLTDTFGIYTDALPAGSEQLAPGETVPIHLLTDVPDVLWSQGVTEVIDLLKLVVSTEAFDPRNLAQEDLDVAAGPRPFDRNLRTPLSSLDRLLQVVGTRRARPKSQVEAGPEWYTQDISIVSVRPLGRVLCEPDRDVEVAPGVTVKRHPVFRGVLEMTSPGEATRGLPAAPVPEGLQVDGALPFGLIASRSSQEDGHALVVSMQNPADVGAVTREEPLVLSLGRELEPDEQILPFAWDGNFYIPLGFGRRFEGRTEIVLERLCEPLPAPDPEDPQRSLGGSIRILFRKLAGQALGWPPAYPVLRLATIDDSGAVSYEDSVVAIKRAVSRSSSVLVYVHGIIGDTQGMARSSRLSGAAPAIGDRYDSILTFDYENINTPIEENAASLRAMLADAGLATGHGKRLDIVAHSMGGLVARHMIEFDGGVDVNCLVTLGTPNDGSPWPSVQRWATVALSLAVNSMSALVWPVSVLAALVASFEKIDAAFDQLEKGSFLLKKLGTASDPATQYHILVGDRSLLDIHRESGRVALLLQHLSPGRLGSKVVDAVFFQQPNDLAVSVASAKAINAERTPAPVIHMLASDHLSFFESQAGLTKLAELLE